MEGKILMVLSRPHKRPRHHRPANRVLAEEFQRRRYYVFRDAWADKSRLASPKAAAADRSQKADEPAEPNDLDDPFQVATRHRASSNYSPARSGSPT
jgi:hypothetical protein